MDPSAAAAEPRSHVCYRRNRSREVPLPPAPHLTSLRELLSQTTAWQLGMTSKFSIAAGCQKEEGAQALSKYEKHGNTLQSAKALRLHRKPRVRLGTSRLIKVSCAPAQALLCSSFCTPEIKYDLQCYQHLCQLLYSLTTDFLAEHRSEVACSSCLLQPQLV